MAWGGALKLKHTFHQCFLIKKKKIVTNGSKTYAFDILIYFVGLILNDLRAHGSAGTTPSHPVCLEVALLPVPGVLVQTQQIRVPYFLFIVLPFPSSFSSLMHSAGIASAPLTLRCGRCSGIHGAAIFNTTIPFCPAAPEMDLLTRAPAARC